MTVTISPLLYVKERLMDIYSIRYFRIARLNRLLCHLSLSNYTVTIVTKFEETPDPSNAHTTNVDCYHGMYGISIMC